MLAGIPPILGMTDIRWRRLLLSIIIWVISEVGLTWLGLDDLADCGEYIYKHRTIAVEIAPAAQAFPTPSLVIPTICSCNGLEI
ncbi:hypothetical protein [Acaryochloris marina]|uniref:hypothetical protein n=1 Tax=Acaryochloris marina TaxID=155978 RepID=UPI0021C30256|nr:hypothetical protein [Acaryochloris marina]BDM78837.1 hypothetical protein AM10699_17060 [Acaryochloris marina MBIC10699]